MTFLFSLFKIIRLAARVVRVVTMAVGITHAVRRYAL